MLTSLSVENFKSWRRIEEMRLAPITGLFGTNRSGKSAILQLLLLLKQTKESTDRAQVVNLGNPSSYVNLGTFRDAIYEHDVSRALSWQLHWQSQELLAIESLQGGHPKPLSGRDFSVSSTVTGGRKRQTTATRVSYEFAQHTFSLERENANSGEYRLSATPREFHFRRQRGRGWPLPGPVRSYGFPDQVRTYFRNADFLADLQLAFERQLDSIYYLRPLRDPPRREYLWAGDRPSDVGMRGEKAVDAVLAARASRKKIGRGKGKAALTLEEYVVRWLRDLRLIVDFAVEEIGRESNLYRVKIKRSREAPHVLIPDVGLGISQVLPVLVLLYYVPKGATVLLEQPEIHLHPSAQSDLADAIIDAVKVRGLQVILESHSEHLLRRLQRRIAEEHFRADQLALYFCEMSDGASQLVPLRLDLWGDIENWPKNFFGDEFSEMAAMTDAALARQRKIAS